MATNNSVTEIRKTARKNFERTGLSEQQARKLQAIYEDLLAVESFAVILRDALFERCDDYYGAHYANLIEDMCKKLTASYRTLDYMGCNTLSALEADQKDHGSDDGRCKRYGAAMSDTNVLAAVEAALSEHQTRVHQAVAILELVSDVLTAGGGNLDDAREGGCLMSAIDGAIRILRPLEVIGDSVSHSGSSGSQAMSDVTELRPASSQLPGRGKKNADSFSVSQAGNCAEEDDTD